MGNKGSKEKKGADAHAPNEVAAAAHDDEPRPRASLEIVKPPATPADQGEHAPNDAPKSPEVAERPMTAEEKKAARKSVKIEKEKEKEKEKQERKRKEKEEKAMKEAEKRMAASAKSRKSVKSKEELRQESHEKVADVMAFLNDVEKKKTEGKEEDAIAMLDDLIAEDNQAKQPEPAPVTEAPPAQEGPRDLVALLEKLQQLIEDPVMLQRLEELLGQKLTSEDDATKLKKLSDAEMERINTVLAQDNQWTQQRRAEREAEKKALTERVNLADKRKSYMAPSAKDQHAAGSGSGSLDVPVTTGSVKRRSMQLNASATGPGSLKKQSEADHAAGGAARTTGPGSLKKSNNVGAAAASPAGAAHTGPGSLRKNDAVAAPTVAPASAAAEPTAAQPASPAPAAAPTAPVAVATTPTITVASPGPVTELRSAMKKGDSATKSRRGVKMQVEGEEEEVRKTPSGKRIVIEGRNKIIERIDDGGAAASGKKEQEHKRASGKSIATAEKDEAKVATPGPAKEAEKSKEDSGKHLHHSHHSGKEKKDEEHKRGSVKRAEKENKHDDKNDKKEEDKNDKDAKEEAPAPAKPSSKKRIVIAEEEEEEEPAVSEEAKAKKEAESQAKLAAYKKELEERKRKSNAEARRKAMEKLEAESK